MSRDDVRATIMLVMVVVALVLIGMAYSVGEFMGHRHEASEPIMQGLAK